MPLSARIQRNPVIEKNSLLRALPTKLGRKLGSRKLSVTSVAPVSRFITYASNLGVGTIFQVHFEVKEVGNHLYAGWKHRLADHELGPYRERDLPELLG
jgi:hypothetical protein